MSAARPASVRGAPPITGAATAPGARPPRRLFLLAQGFTWLWYANAVVVALVGPLGLLPRGAAFPIALLDALHGAVATTVLDDVYARRMRRTRRSRDLFPFFLVASMAAGAWWAVSMGGVTDLLWGDAVATGHLRLSPLVTESWLVRRARVFEGALATVVAFCWSIGWYLVVTRREARVAVARSGALEARLQAAQLAALRYQVNPHFLFNALTTLHGLIGEDPGKAQRVVRSLAAYLRYTLAPDLAPTDTPDGGVDRARGDAAPVSAAGPAPAALIPLAMELEALRGYLAVESARFEDALTVAWRIEPGADAMLVPPLLLQPLVENAIRHGTPDGDGTQHVGIAATCVAGTLALEVASSGRWRGERATTPLDTREAAIDAAGGIGLANVRARLALAFPGRHDLTITRGPDDVRIRIRVVPA